MKAIEANPESFDPFGQVIEASADGLEFGPADAQLQLHRGTPRCPFHLSLPLSLSWLSICVYNPIICQACKLFEF